MEFLQRAEADLTDVAKAEVDKALATIAGNPDGPDIIAAQWAALAEVNESAAARRLTQIEHPPELSGRKPPQPRASQRPRKPPAQLRASQRPPKPPPQTVIEFVQRAKAELTDLPQAEVDKALATIAGNPDGPDIIAAQWAALAELNESAAARRLTQIEHPPELSGPKHAGQESQAIGLH